MEAEDFIDLTTPGDLLWALDPVPPPPGFGACAEHDGERFETRARQQAAFDGEAADAGDYEAARAICLSCPVFDACRRYADASGDPHVFLAGLTAEQRSARRAKSTEIATRRTQVERLNTLGATTSVIAALVGRDPSLIRADLRIIRQRTESNT